MGLETVPETSVIFKQMTWLVAQDFIDMIFSLEIMTT
jgi:hypothetical protein